MTLMWTAIMKSSLRNILSLPLCLSKIEVVLEKITEGKISNSKEKQNIIVLIWHASYAILCGSLHSLLPKITHPKGSQFDTWCWCINKIWPCDYIQSSCRFAVCKCVMCCMLFSREASTDWAFCICLSTYLPLFIYYLHLSTHLSLYRSTCGEEGIKYSMLF